MCSCVCCDVERSAEAAAGRLVVPTRCQVAGSGTARGSVLTEAELQISGPLCTDNIFMFTTSYKNCFFLYLFRGGIVACMHADAGSPSSSSVWHVQPSPIDALNTSLAGVYSAFRGPLSELGLDFGIVFCSVCS